MTYADHVLVVAVIGEIRHEPSRTETERGEGLIGRTVKLGVNKVLWSAPDAPQRAPTTLDLAAAGWAFNNNDPSGLRHQMAGSSVDKLIATLKEVPIRPEEGYGPGECDPSDR